MVIDVDHRLISKNVYWPLLSDFVNILSQEKIALTIIENKKYFNLWLRFLTLFQGTTTEEKILDQSNFFSGMNINERLLTQHVEYEPQGYMYAFTIELEISAAAMWCFVSHLKSNVRKCENRIFSITKEFRFLFVQYSPEKFTEVIKQIVQSISEWLQSLNFDSNRTDPWKLSFHLPLHRYLAVFAYNAIHKYNIDPALFLPIDDQMALWNLIFHPLRTIVRVERRWRREN